MADNAEAPSPKAEAAGAEALPTPFPFSPGAEAFGKGGLVSQASLPRPSCRGGSEHKFILPRRWSSRRHLVASQGMHAIFR